MKIIKGNSFNHNLSLIPGVIDEEMAQDLRPVRLHLHTVVVRLITKNILLVLIAEKNTVDWRNQHLIVPLPAPVKVEKGDKVHIKFSYSSGAQLEALRESISVSKL